MEDLKIHKVGSVSSQRSDYLIRVEGSQTDLNFLLLLILKNDNNNTGESRKVKRLSDTLK